LAVPGFELGALWNHTSSSFCSGYFWNRISLFVQPSWNAILFYASCNSGMSGACHHAHWDGVSQNFFPGLACNHDVLNIRYPHSLGWQACATMPGYWLRWDFTLFALVNL
jgi:hypothetical protein